MDEINLMGYWNLDEKPFENTGDPKFFYYSPCHKEALVRLIYVIKEKKAGALLAGDYGTGKTSIANELVKEIRESEEYACVSISNPLLTPKELLQEISYQLGMEGKGTSRLKMRYYISDKLKELGETNHHAVIIVDEAHLMTRKDTLEELRLLMNQQNNNKFLATIIMMGQLELRKVINSMPQFKQRFAMFYVLKHLDREQTGKYIEHRLSIAGTQRQLFADEAKDLIYTSSYGRPRQINNICDMSFLVGFMRKVDWIDNGIVQDVIKDIEGEI